MKRTFSLAADWTAWRNLIARLHRKNLLLPGFQPKQTKEWAYTAKI